MKHHRIVLLTALSGSLIGVSHAHASYLQLEVTSQQAQVSGILRNVFRVYALFSDPNDYLTAVSGSPIVGNLVIQSRNLLGTGPGSNFVNVLGGGATAPQQYYIMQNPNIVFDTFVTIGVSVAEQGSGTPPNSPDETGLSPGFNGIGNVNQINTDNGGWFTPGPVEQGRAGYLGDGDPLLRVLMMQLTVSSTSCVRGTVAITGVNNNPLAGGTSFNATGQVFHCIPAPGILPLLGAGLLGIASRRRRVFA